MMTKIIKIIKQKSYYEVHVTDNAVYEVDGELLQFYDLHEGETYAIALLENLHDKSRFRRAYQRACYLLNDRDYSYKMLYQKLMLSYQDDLLCKRVLEKLVAINLINDRRYAERYAEYLVQKKGYGIYRAKQEMLKKGLDKNVIQEFLAEQQEFALENINSVLAKKYGRILQDEQDFKTRNKVIAGMVRLGYDVTSIKYAIEDYFAEQEEK